LFVVKQTSPFFKLCLEHTVLLDEIIDDRLLLAVEAAGQGDYKEMKLSDSTNSLAL
jgi:hypothetical protein